MNATGLPIPVSTAPSSSAEPLLPPSGANAPAPTDFMLALAQMLGAATPATAQPEAAAAVAATLLLEEEAAVELPEDAALALLSLPVAPVQPQIVPVSFPSQVVATEADPLEMLGLNPRPEGPSARDLALLQAMTERLEASQSDATTDVHSAPTVMPTIDLQQPVRATADGAITRTVHVPVGTPAWADEIGSRLTLMTQKGEHTASLRLSPEHLGPLEIRIAMRDDQASVWFGAAHADTRAAIEHALPRLREMFTAQGMSLADAGVFHEPPRQHAPASTSPANSAADSDTTAEQAVSASVQVKLGLVDAYA